MFCLSCTRFINLKEMLLEGRYCVLASGEMQRKEDASEDEEGIQRSIHKGVKKL